MTNNQEHAWKYYDPESNNPSRKGLLLSNEIEKFCKNKLLIAENYHPTRLRPAAYTLTIGGPYVDSDGKLGRLTYDQESFEMQPNSIVYVSTAEQLNLPFYIAARFNLRVKWVYKGILLGTGPQVEPGYKGYLSCPLYNLTNRPIRIRRGDEFATIDFERTTDFCKGKPWEEVKSQIEKGEKLDKLVVDGETYLLFHQEPYKALQHLPDYDVVSSLVQMAKEVRTWRHIGIGFVISFFALALSLLAINTNIYRELNANTREVAESKTELRGTVDDVGKLEQSMTSLEQRIHLLEHKSPGPPATQKQEKEK